jgi:anti-sigma regulatory factor (Ser/Thr protein kinase)
LEAPFLRIRLELPDQAASVPLCRRALRLVLGELAVAAKRADDIELAISEATGNVVRHAFAHPGHQYQVTLEFFADSVRLRVEDDGIGFLRAAVPDPDLEQLGGRGLWLIEQLADAVTVDALPGGGCRLQAEFTLPSPPALPRGADEVMM